MRHIPDSLRQFVIERANNRCEYCGLSQSGQAATFHIDHVIPVAGEGETVEDNLALACVSCSLRKGAKLQAVDAVAGREVSVYNPRKQRWSEHFQWNDTSVEGISEEGRATVRALDMNHSVMVAIREEEKFFARHPPP